MLADADTGLGANDVFYFGNAIGETGDTYGLVPADAKVNATDQLGARSHPHTILDPAPIYDAYDFNRDKKVNATDELIVRNNQTTVLNALKLITVPAEGMGEMVAPQGGDGALALGSLVVSGVAPEQTDPIAWPAQASAAPAANVLVPAAFWAPALPAPAAGDSPRASQTAGFLLSAAASAGQAASPILVAELEGLLLDVLSGSRLAVPLGK